MVVLIIKTSLYGCISFLSHTRDTRSKGVRWEFRPSNEAETGRERKGERQNSKAWGMGDVHVKPPPPLSSGWMILGIHAHHITYIRTHARYCRLAASPSPVWRHRPPYSAQSHYRHLPPFIINVT